MARIEDIRQGIALALKNTIPNAQCNGYLLDNPTSPAFEVELSGVVYDLGMSRGLDDYQFTVRGFVSSNILDIAAQQTLDNWLRSTGTYSVKAGLEADPTLSGSCSSSRVERTGAIKEYTPVSSPGTKFYGAEWTLRVYATGD